MKDNPYPPLNPSPLKRLRIALPCQDREDKIIAQALRWLAHNRVRQPSLQTLAQALDTSPFVLQKRFTRWAGISPKDFLALLNAKRARQLLQKGSSILEASLETGLSSPSRLHDLFVRIEAMTPGDYKRQGEHLTLFFGSHNTPFGKAHMVASSRGLCALGFHGERATDARVAKNDFQRRWPKARIQEDASKTRSYAEKIFPDPNNKKSFAAPEQLSLHLLATPFRLQVWRALLDIPKGSCKSYGTEVFALSFVVARRHGFDAHEKVVQTRGGGKSCLQTCLQDAGALLQQLPRTLGVEKGEEVFRTDSRPAREAFLQHEGACVEGLRKGLQGGLSDAIVREPPQGLGDDLVLPILVTAIFLMRSRFRGEGLRGG